MYIYIHREKMREVLLAAVWLLPGCLQAVQMD